MDSMERQQKLSRIDENWIYRYRSFSALSLKELMYNEIYFAYPDELNDPLDLRVEFIISKGSWFVYHSFLLDAFRIINHYKRPPQKTQDIMKEISKQYSERERRVIDLLDENHKTWLKDQFKKYGLETEKFDTFFKGLINGIINMEPKNLRSISFSKSYKNPLLWSLYAEKHSGFCMIFSPSDQNLNLKEHPENEKFVEHGYQKVNYSNNNNIDLSLLFYEDESKDDVKFFSDFYPELIKKALLTKHPNWEKEEEVRICVNPIVRFSHLDLDQIDSNLGFRTGSERLSRVERTYYFDPSQFVGVIFGFSMGEAERQEIFEIIRRKNQKTTFFEAIPVGNDIEIQFVARMEGDLCVYTR